jgi:hypothetical protein
MTGMNYGIGICPALQLVINLRGDIRSPNCVWPRRGIRGTGGGVSCSSNPERNTLCGDRWNTLAF